MDALAISYENANPTPKLLQINSQASSGVHDISSDVSVNWSNKNQGLSLWFKLVQKSGVLDYKSICVTEEYIVVSLYNFYKQEVS